MSWLLATYESASFFSLRPSLTTASAGKTLLVPTPFAVKTALIDISIRGAGVAATKERFPTIRDLRIALSLPTYLVVCKQFGQVRRPVRLESGENREKDEAHAREDRRFPFSTTLAPNEFVQYVGSLTFAFRGPEGAPPAWFAELLAGIGRLGKRGGFFQLLDWPHPAEELDGAFVELTRDSMEQDTLAVQGVLQMLDDYGEGITFAHINRYDNKPIRLGRERIFHNVVLPYLQDQASHAYSRFTRISEEQSAGW